MRIILSGILLLAFNISNAQNWGPQQKVNASDRAQNDSYGYALDISGNYAIVGAYRENTPPPANSDGAAYIYERDELGNWIEVQKLVPDDRAANDRFGWSVAIVANDDVVYAAASATFHDDEGASTTNGGATYIFERNPLTEDWEEITKVFSDDLASWDYFGFDIDITAIGDKGYLIVGVQDEDNDQFLEDNMGAAYIFQRNNTGDWVQMQKITSDVRKSEDNFGRSVAIDVVGENLFALIGAPLEDDGLTDSNADGTTATGSAYIFSLDDLGQWNQIQKLIASDRDVSEGDFFGNSVALAGESIVIGAYNDAHDSNDENAVVGAGSAYIYKQDLTGTWGFAQKIVAPVRDISEQFGRDVAVSGNIIIVGSHRDAEDANEENAISTAGSAYIYEKDSLGIWNLSQKVVAEERQGTDYFGWSVSTTNETVLVGAYREDHDNVGENFLANAGSVFFYEKANDTECTKAEAPVLAASSITICAEDSVTLHIESGALNSAQEWGWYAGSCEGTSIGTGTSIKVAPTLSTIYFARGEGSCVESGICGEITITVSEPMVLSVSITDETAGGDGAIDMSVSGGVAPYSFDWNNDEEGDFDDTEDLTNLVAGIYEVTVMDNVECQISLKTIVGYSSTTEIISGNFNNQFFIYPNPTRGVITIVMLDNENKVSAYIVNSNGKIMRNYNLLDKTVIDINDLPNGTYLMYLNIDGQRTIQKIMKY